VPVLRKLLRKYSVYNRLLLCIVALSPAYIIYCRIIMALNAARHFHGDMTIVLQLCSMFIPEKMLICIKGRIDLQQKFTKPYVCNAPVAFSLFLL
jgi:hypothetical protein